MNIIHFSNNGGLSKKIPSNAKDVVIAINSKDTSVHQVTLPKMSNKKAMKAIPYSLEPRLLEDVDSLQFVINRSSTQSTWDVIVVSKEIVRAIEGRLQEAKCKPLAILPDFMLLSFSEGSVSYYEKDDFITFRSAANQGGCLDSKNFHSLFVETNLVKTNFSYTSKVKMSIQTSTSQKGLSEYIGPWRIPAALALIALLMATTQIWVNNSKLNALLSQHKINNENQFRSLFPNVGRIVNMRVQTEQGLSDLSQRQLIFQNDLLVKLSSDVFPGSKVDKIVFENQVLTLEVSK